MLLKSIIIFVICNYALKVLNFAIFDHFRQISYPQKFSKPQNCEIKFPKNLTPPEFKILFFLIFDQNMILMPVYRIPLLIVTMLEFL